MNDDTNANDVTQAMTLASEIEYTIRELTETLALINSDARQVRSGRMLEGMWNVCSQLGSYASEALDNEDVVWNEFPPLVGD